jgi:hypothetical protein
MMTSTSTRHVGPLIIFAVIFVLSTGSGASADDCAALGGVLAGGECQLSAPVTKSGTFSLDETLHILGTGKITVPSAPGGNTLTLNITGNLIMDVPTLSGRSQIIGDVTTANGVGATITVDASGDIELHGNGTIGARISSNQTAGSCSGGHGGDITLTAGGSIDMQAGSTVTSIAACNGGEIIITADLAADIDGVVQSESTTPVGRGGPITIKAGCDLTISDTGKVISRGRDHGPDLVHLEGGCRVTIFGLVASTGPSHVANEPNRCKPPFRPGKPASANACVEVWSGGSLEINSTPPHTGEVNADTGMSGGDICCAWIDLFARGDVSIVGDSSGPYAVHANQFLSNGFGGLITVKSTEANVSASRQAIQASDTASGGDGGKVTIEAAGAVHLDTAKILAQGDFNSTGGFGIGGTISGRAFNGNLTWTSGTGDVRPTGSQVPPANDGHIFLQACGPVTLGASFPVNGSPDPGFPTIVAPACGGAPALPGFVALPICNRTGGPTASASAFGEAVNVQVIPAAGNGVLVQSGPLPIAAGTAPPPFSNSNSAASSTVSSAPTGQMLQTGALTVNASSNVPGGNDVSADATVNTVNLAVTSLTPLLTLNATIVQSTANIGGSCGALTTSGTTTLANATGTLLGNPLPSIQSSPPPNTVLLDTLGIKVVLNEQFTGGDGVNSRSLTVNAIHVYLSNVNVANVGVLNGDIIIAQSHAQEQCGGAGVVCPCLPAGSSIATSTAFGESVAANVLPFAGNGVVIGSGPLPAASGTAPPPYSDTDSVSTVTVSSVLTGQILQTGAMTVNASSTVPGGNNVHADATVNNVDVDVVSALVSALLTLDATVVQSTADINGPCGALVATGTTTLTSATGTVLGVPLNISNSPPPNTVLVDTAGIRVVLNEQVQSGDGVTSLSLTVNAIHITFTNVVLTGIGVLNGDIIIASSHAERVCGAGTCP